MYILGEAGEHSTGFTFLSKLDRKQAQLVANDTSIEKGPILSRQDWKKEEHVLLW